MIGFTSSMPIPYLRRPHPEVVAPELANARIYASSPPFAVLPLCLAWTLRLFRLGAAGLVYRGHRLTLPPQCRGSSAVVDQYVSKIGIADNSLADVTELADSPRSFLRIMELLLATLSSVVCIRFSYLSV